MTTLHKTMGDEQLKPSPSTSKTVSSMLTFFQHSTPSPLKTFKIKRKVLTDYYVASSSTNKTQCKYILHPYNAIHTILHPSSLVYHLIHGK